MRGCRGIWGRLGNQLDVPAEPGTGTCKPAGSQPPAQLTPLRIGWAAGGWGETESRSQEALLRAKAS